MRFKVLCAVSISALALSACSPPGEGAAGFRDVDWPRADQIMSASDNREIEVLLGQLGYLAGGYDGRIGVDTREAIRAYQGDIGAPVTGFVSQPLLFSLRINAPVSASASAPAAAAATAAPTASATSTSTVTAAPRTQSSAPRTRSISRESNSSGGGGLGGGSGGAWN